jgi:hypothetical protein
MPAIRPSADIRRPPRSDRPSGVHQDAFARFRKTISRARSTKARRLAANVVPIIREGQRAGATTLRQIAEALNARGMTTPRGGGVALSLESVGVALVLFGLAGWLLS